jgi:Uma2 family endonuclease
MATVQSPLEQRMVLHHISWDTYERLLADHEQSSAPRFTYDRGTLEILSPLPKHEMANRSLASLVEIAVEEMALEFANLGSTTFKRREFERGFEPDSCFYIQHEAAVRGRERIDLRVDPPPDLVIEIDFTHETLYKPSIYAQFRVPEVWRYDGERLEVRVLTEDRYVESAASRVRPGVRADAASDLLRASGQTGRLEWLRRVRAWARGLSAARPDVSGKERGE